MYAETAETIEKAIETFKTMRSYQPYKLGGKWYVAQVNEGFRAFRTKKAATRHSILDSLWLLDFPRQ